MAAGDNVLVERVLRHFSEHVAQVIMGPKNPDRG